MSKLFLIDLVFEVYGIYKIIELIYFKNREN